MSQQINTGNEAGFARDDYLNINMLQAVSGNSSNLVQLQALQQVLIWLLQLPAGAVRDTAVDVLRYDADWLQQLLQCWAAEVQQTGCSVAQATAAAAEQYADKFGAAAVPDEAAGAAGAAGTSRGIGGYLAGLCQLLLQLLGACCKQLAAAGANSEAGHMPMLQLAGDLLDGTSALLLHTTNGRQQQQQQRCTHAGLWRRRLLVNLQRCQAGMGSVEVVAQQVCSAMLVLLT
jgi:hypothetical protein